MRHSRTARHAAPFFRPSLAILLTAIPVAAAPLAAQDAAGGLEIELRQVRAAGRFQLPLEVGVYINRDALPAQVTTVDVGPGANRFVIPVPAEPSDVRLDPGTRALFRAEFGRGGIEY